MKHSLLILISFLLLSSPLFGDNHKGETLYRWGKYPDYKWLGFGEKDTNPKYQGQVKNGVPNGLGYVIYPDGEKYVGSWKDGNQNGHGTYTWNDGEKYVGSWKDGNQNGHGTYTFSNGEKYVGSWKDGKYNGQGTFTSLYGNKEVGEYKDGKFWNGNHYYDGKILFKFVNGKPVKP